MFVGKCSSSNTLPFYILSHPCTLNRKQLPRLLFPLRCEVALQVGEEAEEAWDEGRIPLDTELRHRGTALPSPCVPLSVQGWLKLPRAAPTAECHGLFLQDIPVTIKYSSTSPFPGFIFVPLTLTCSPPCLLCTSQGQNCCTQLWVTDRIPEHSLDSVE